MHFDGDPFTMILYASAKKKRKKGQEFQISHFYGWFSNDIMAVKGLIQYAS